MVGKNDAWGVWANGFGDGASGGEVAERFYRMGRQTNIERRPGRFLPKMEMYVIPYVLLWMKY